jgi:fatty acid desaturase
MTSPPTKHQACSADENNHPTGAGRTLRSPSKSVNSSQIWRENEGVSLLCPFTYVENAGDLPKYSVQEVAKHSRPGDCWFVIHGVVYDASKFCAHHPGGWLPMAQFAGKSDCSDVYEAFHPAKYHKTLLPSMAIGQLENDTGDDDPVEQACREVRQELLSRGLFETSPWYYVQIFLALGLLFALAVFFTLQPDLYLLGAVCMGMFWQQVAFVGHDVGHNAISHTRLRDLYYGVLFGNTLMGISLGWWKQSHNVHHVATNSVEHDPDIQHMPVFAVSEPLLQEPFWSTYHKKQFAVDLVTRSLVSVQHLLFYPVMALARINLYVQSWVNLIIQPHGKVPFRSLEICTLLGFFAWILALMWQLPTHAHALTWIFTAHAVSGLLHVQICISHFTMATHRVSDPTRHPGFYRLQLQTTMNVITPRGFDWVHGGLQYQIEHHMFPRLPRHNLRTARDLLLQKLPKDVVDKEYVEFGFFRANYELLKSMRRAALQARKLVRGNAGFFESPLVQGLQLEG